MSAARKLEVKVSVEELIANIESDMGHVRSTLADVKGEAKELRTELHSFKTEVAKDFGLVRSEMEKGFGSIKVWVLATIGGAVISVIGGLVGLHALKVF
jgi:phage-related protein